MTTIELKSSFHNLIDNINDEGILSKFYDIISKANENKEGMLWNRLSESERDELLLIEKESHDSTNLISNSEMQQKHKKWL
jgi:hypothetical protein